VSVSMAVSIWMRRSKIMEEDIGFGTAQNYADNGAENASGSVQLKFGGVEASLRSMIASEIQLLVETRHLLMGV